MTRRALIRPAADRDIDSQVRYLMLAAGEDVAMRFYDAVHNAVLGLLETPGKGRRRLTRRAELAGLRTWPVAGFERHLIFYLETPDGLEVVRVLHGARDLDAILDE